VRCSDASSGFSGSPECGDRDAVLARGARLGGAAMAVVVAGNVACALGWAPFIDRRGRRYVACRSLAGSSLGLLALAGAARRAALAESVRVAWTYSAYFFLAATSATTPALSAAAADLAPKAMQAALERFAAFEKEHGDASSQKAVTALAKAYVQKRKDAMEE